jgi:hypothetical protein
MSELLNAMRGALTLNIATLAHFRDREDVFRRGVTVFVLVALLVGGVSFIVNFVDRLVTPPEAGLAQATQTLEQMMRFMPPEAAQVFQKQFLANFEAGFEIGRRVEALPTPLPKLVGAFFETLSGWPDRPLAMLGGFLAYGIWVMLAAKLLGGTGRLQEFLGTAALSSVPYLMLALEKVPCLGSLVGIAAWIWSTLIWIAATAVVHGWAIPQATPEGAAAGYHVQWGKATLAVILPALALIVLILVGVLSLGAIIAIVTQD